MVSGLFRVNEFKVYQNLKAACHQLLVVPDSAALPVRRGPLGSPVGAPSHTMDMPCQHKMHLRRSPARCGRVHSRTGMPVSPLTAAGSEHRDAGKLEEFPTRQDPRLLAVRARERGGRWHIA
jgi:hypothetical protein